MQLAWDEHFAEIVLLAWQEYLHSEQELTEAAQSGKSAWRRRAGYQALRHGAAAAIFLHHYSEVVVRAKPAVVLATLSNVPTLKVAHVRKWLASHCYELRIPKLCTDVALLGDVANALKHCELTLLPPAAYQVSTIDQVLVVAPTYGSMAYGLGKFGSDQVVVLAKGGTRPLSTVLQNVIDAWRRAVGMHLPAIGAL